VAEMYDFVKHTRPIVRRSGLAKTNFAKNDEKITKNVLECHKT
jgi:hypothetical protein